MKPILGGSFAGHFRGISGTDEVTTISLIRVTESVPPCPAFLSQVR